MIPRNIAVLKAYRELLIKAAFIVNGWPRLSDTPQHGKDDYPNGANRRWRKVTLTWVDECSYEHFSFTRSHSFPIEMLGWTDEELSVWKAQEEKRLNAEDEARHEQYRIEREQKERATYAALKAKYG